MVLEKDFKSKESWLWVLPVAVYLLCGAQYLDRPGLYYDELFWLNAAVGMPVEGLFTSLRIGPLPVMVMGYIGALKSWVYTLPLAIFGTSAVAIRSVALFLGCCVLVLLWKYCRHYFSVRWATLITLMVAVDPSFIYTTRNDWGPVTLMMICKLLALLALAKYVEEGKPRDLYLCGAALILGTYDKANFAWFFAAFLITAVVVYWKKLWYHGKGCPKKTACAYGILGTGTALVGIVYLIPLFTSGGEAGSFQLGRVIQILRDTLDGNGVYSIFFAAEIPHRTCLYTVFLAALALCLSLSIWSLLTGKQEKIARFALFHAISTVLIIVFMACTSEFGGPHHIMSIYPAPQLLLGCALLLARGLIPQWNRVVTRGVSAVVCMGVIASCVLTTHAYLVILRDNDTYNPMWDPEITAVGEAVEAYEYDFVITVDWGFANQMIAMIDGNADRGKIRDIWPTFNDYNGAEESVSWLKDSFFAGKKTVVLAHVADKASFPAARENFLRFIEDAGLVPAECKTIVGSDGQPLYEVYYFNGIL